MSKLIRRKKEIGAALAVALQLTTLGLIGVIAHFTGGPQQAEKAPADSQMSAAPETAPVQAAPVSDRSALRASAVYANKVYGPRASQVFNLAASRAAAAQNVQHTQNTQGPESPNDERPSPAIRRITRHIPMSISTAPAFSPAKPST